MKHTLTKLTALLLLCMLLTSCGGSSYTTALNNAYVAAGYPSGLTRVYHYHFQGTETLNTVTETTIEKAFAVDTSLVPDKGHVFFISTDDDQIYVLTDEKGTVIAYASSNELVAMGSTSIDMMLALTDQLLAFGGYLLSAIDGSSETDKEVINGWHYLTEKTINNLYQLQK